jgi:uncharacterized lipoprotein YmbA
MRSVRPDFPHVAVRHAAVAYALTAVATLLALTACVRGKVPARELYRLRTISASPGAPATDGDGHSTFAALGELVSVEPYATPGVYGDPQIVYREGETRYGTYPNREWALPLGTMLATLTAEALRAQQGLGGRVHDGEPLPAGRGLRWRGTVHEFEEVDRGGNVFAAVRLDARLVRASDDSVLWSGTTRAEAPVGQTRDMTAVVERLSSVAATAIATLTQDATPAFRGIAAR